EERILPTIALIGRVYDQSYSEDVTRMFLAGSAAGRIAAQQRRRERESRYSGFALYRSDSAHLSGHMHTLAAREVADLDSLTADASQRILT
ncbi:MAG: hypothetical protein WB822_18745, partial [Rhodoplanes sp.]